MTADDTKVVAAEPASINGTKTADSNGSTTKSPLSHPLGPLSADEISRSSALIRAEWPEGTKFQFKILTLLEPPKPELVPYLTAEKAGETPKPIDRKSQVVYYLRTTVSTYLSTYIPSLARSASKMGYIAKTAIGQTSRGCRQLDHQQGREQCSPRPVHPRSRRWRGTYCHREGHDGR